MPTKSEALTLISRLAVGDEVVVQQDGREFKVTVQRAIHHTEGFGNVYSQQVTVGYGPGRWNRAVSANAMAAGYVGLRLP